MKTITTEQHLYARIAGLSYVIFTLAGLFKNLYLETRLNKLDSVFSSGLFINEMHFRIGIAAELVMFLAVVAASVSFYTVQKSLNKPLVQMALCMRMLEIIIGSMAVVFSMAMLALSNKSYLVNMLDLQQMHTLVVIASSFSVPAYEYSWVPMGVAGLITFYLFFKTRYIPRAWSVWGMVTYSSMIIYPLLKVLIPDLPKEAMYIMFPGALFELLVGIWLMVNGIRISR